MRKRSEVSAAAVAADEDSTHDRGTEVVVPHDPNNEVVIIGAALIDVEQRESLTRRIPSDKFLVDEHKAIWTGLKELVLRKLDFDPATFQRLVGSSVPIKYVTKIMTHRPEVPANIEFHVQTLLWDAQRASAVEGPIASLLEAVQNQREEPARIRALARSVGDAFEHTGSNHLLDPKELVRQQMHEVDKRIAGHASYPFGIDGLDYYEVEDADEPPRRRILAGAAPGLVTVVTGVPGGGKSTVVMNLALGLRRQKRRVLMGAWEMQGGPTLEIMAAIDLGMSRSRVTEGRITPEERVALEDRMHLLSRTIKFMGNPFRRGRSSGKKITNEHNLDIVRENIGDSGCDVVILDLWKRCLRDTRPDEEEEALYVQQAMLEEMRVHGILVQQLRLKDVEQRPDKRPTREAIKGSGAWTEVPDLILGAHRPALWKPRIDDDTLELFILKQRFGKWPLGIAFDWDGDLGRIGNGRSIAYDAPGEASEVDGFIPAPQLSGRRRGRRAA